MPLCLMFGAVRKHHLPEVALHEPIADIAKYLEDSGATGITVESIIGQIASPDVKKTFEVVLADVMAAAYPDAFHRRLATTAAHV